MLRYLEMCFLIKGGDVNWLIVGLDEVPEKLRKLSRVNNILAHQPWKLSKLELNVNKFC